MRSFLVIALLSLAMGFRVAHHHQQADLSFCQGLTYFSVSDCEYEYSACTSSGRDHDECVRLIEEEDAWSANCDELRWPDDTCNWRAWDRARGGYATEGTDPADDVIISQAEKEAGYGGYGGYGSYGYGDYGYH